MFPLSHILHTLSLFTHDSSPPPLFSFSLAPSSPAVRACHLIPPLPLFSLSPSPPQLQPLRFNFIQLLRFLSFSYHLPPMEFKASNWHFFYYYYKRTSDLSAFSPSINEGSKTQCEFFLLSFFQICYLFFFPVNSWFVVNNLLWMGAFGCAFDLR